MFILISISKYNKTPGRQKPIDRGTFTNRSRTAYLQSLPLLSINFLQRYHLVSEIELEVQEGDFLRNCLFWSFKGQFVYTYFRTTLVAP